MIPRLATHLLLCLALLVSGVASTVHVAGHRDHGLRDRGHQDHVHRNHAHRDHGHRDHGPRGRASTSFEDDGCLAYHLFCASQAGVPPGPGTPSVPRADAPASVPAAPDLPARRAFATFIRGPPSLS